MDFELENDELEGGVEEPGRGAVSGTSVPPKDIPKRVVKQKKSSIPWKRIRLFSRAGLWIGLIFYVYGTYFVDKFDAKLDVNMLVRKNPEQIDAPEDSFTFNYRGKSYEVQPVAEYEIAGLVVTHNDISSIMDAYHDSDSVDFRDICLVWGINVTNNIFRRADFFSMPWSCHFKFHDSLAAQSFNPDQVSNNHLLTDNEKVREKILSMRVGDQVFLRGKLINYWPAGMPEYSRNTSLVRTDTGDGACEVMWVEEAKILRKADSNWDSLRSIGIWLLGLSVLAGAYVFFAAPYGS